MKMVEVRTTDKNSGRPDALIAKSDPTGFIPEELEYKEYTFTANELPSFKSFRIKFLMTSTNQAFVPRLFKFESYRYCLMDYVKVKDNEHLIRNTNSNCIVNTNKAEYEEYLTRRKLKKMKKIKLIILKEIYQLLEMKLLKLKIC